MGSDPVLGFGQQGGKHRVLSQHLGGMLEARLLEGSWEGLGPPFWPGNRNRVAILGRLLGAKLALCWDFDHDLFIDFFDIVYF